MLSRAPSVPFGIGGTFCYGSSLPSLPTAAPLPLCPGLCQRSNDLVFGKCLFTEPLMGILYLVIYVRKLSYGWNDEILYLTLTPL